MSVMRRLKLFLARRMLSSRKIAFGTENALEIWVHNKVREEFKRSPELRKAIGREELGTVQRSDLREYQLHMLRRQMAYVMANSYYYQRKYEKAGVRPEDIRTWEDLERIPVTEPADLAAEPFTFLCVSQSKVMRVFSTTGTSGTRKRLFYTQGDVLNIVDSITAALKTVGLTEKDTLQIMFPAVAAWDPGLMLDGACKVAGIRSVVESTADLDGQFRTMRENGTTMMIGLTSFLHRITVLGKDRYDLRSFGMKTVICAAEPLSEAMRREMIAAWGCPVLSVYGMTEMGLATTIECDEYDGHHVNDADFLVECVEPGTGRHLGDREPGELLFTSLAMEGTPLIRYRSYDLSHTIEPPCPCGFRTLGKVDKPRGRLDGQTKIGYGQKVYPLLFDEAILSVEGAVSYRMVLEKEDYRDKLTFTVEYKGDPEEGRRKVLEAINALDEVQSARENDLVLPPEVVIRPAGEGEFSPKSKTISDLRPVYDEAKAS